MTVTIRAATIRDIPHLANFLMEATGGLTEAAYHGVLPDRPTNLIVEHLMSRAGTTSSFENWIVAEQAGEVVGGLNAYRSSAPAQDPPNPLLLEERLYLFQPMRQLRSQVHTEERYHIRAVAVYPEFRGVGAGSALMSQAHGEGQAKGFTETSLVVFSENTRAVELYKRLGYTEVARVPAPEHKLIRYGGDVQFMIKRL
jgi:ribosomal protein S18 acetylase RimI-like enzyme